MKKLLPLFIVITFFLSNSIAQQKSVPQLTLFGVGYIKIIAEKVVDTLTIHTKFCSAVPFRGCVFNNTEITKEGTYYISYAMTKPGMCYFMDQEFQLFLIPGDTVVVKLTTEINENNELVANYQTMDAINDYYQTYYSLYQADTVSKTFNDALTSKEYKNILIVIDSALNKKITYLSNNCSRLPDWFITTEKVKLTYTAGIDALSYYCILSAEERKIIPFKAPELKNLDAILSETYYEFLDQYLNFKCVFEDNNDRITRLFNIYNSRANLIDSILEGEMKKYYITCILSDLYHCSESHEEIQKVDNYIKIKFANLPSDDLKFINSERNRTINYLKRDLSKGDTAPNFFLKDADGKRFDIASFAGKSVYLHFWATWCGPCIKEIPNLNKLHSKLGDKPIEIVNICMDNNPEKWKQIIEKKELKGINLICAGNWKKNLMERYIIGELPHYTLIDKNGLIVYNKCKGPVDIYSELMKLVGGN